MEGVDASPDAVEACRARGIEVTLADVLTYLETRPDDPVRGVSAIQLIEHLRGGPGSTSSRRSTVRRTRRGLLLETINGQNPEAIADYFVADVTPGRGLETLRLMAEHAGFDEVQVRFLHEDHRGRAQDVAIWRSSDVMTGSEDAAGATPASRRRPGERGRRGRDARPGGLLGGGGGSGLPADARALRERLDAFTYQMRADQRQAVPVGEAFLGSDAGWKRGLKQFVWRLRGSRRCATTRSSRSSPR